MDLSDVLDRTPPLRIIRGIVLQITGDTFVMDYLGARITDIAPLDHYTPVVDDIAIVLVWPKGGMIALGSNNGSGAGPTPPDTSTTLTVVADGNATVVLASGTYTWVPGVLQQQPDRAACWFYDTGMFTPLAGALIASFEVEITRTSGGPLELLLHNNPAASGALAMASPTWFISPEIPAAGVPTWVSLPVGWGEALVNGQASGVGIGMNQHTGVYSGTGRLRFTSI